MDISTITQKGQVVIPKPLRDQLDMKPADKIIFEVKSGVLIGQKIPSIEEVFGLFAGGRKLTRKQEKQAIREAIIRKYNKRGIIK